VTPLLVALGASVGAALRFWIGHHLDTRAPTGTLLVNVAGSFVLGLLVGASPSADAMALLGTGFCGGLTTYSAFAIQTRDQTRDRGPLVGVGYAAATLSLAVTACALGFAVASVG
jgi:CrcB protein